MDIAEAIVDMREKVQEYPDLPEWCHVIAGGHEDQPETWLALLDEAWKSLKLELAGV